MESPFTIVDNSIDIVGAIIFLMVILWSVHYLWVNHISIQTRIVYGAMITISGLQVFQVISQVLSSNFASFRIWDISNYVTAMTFLALTHYLQKKKP